MFQPQPVTLTVGIGGIELFPESLTLLLGHESGAADSRVLAHALLSPVTGALTRTRAHALTRGL